MSNSRSFGRVAALLGGLVAALAAPAANAAPPPLVTPTPPSETEAAEGGGALGFLSGLQRSQYLLGDLWGLRSALSRYGITLLIQETSEGLGNVTGGARRGFAYEGLTQVDLQLNTQRAFGFYGGTLNVSALNYHGTNLSATNLHSLQTASGIEADNGTRLWELWYDQKLLEEDRLDVKIGQQSLDQEFMVSANALLFVNTMFGWPMLPSADLPGGGPAYPLSALGVRAAARPVDGLQVLAGVFNGSPVASNTGDPQQQDPHGTSFPTRGGALAIAEIQWSYPAMGSMVSPDERQPLGWTYRLGVFTDTESFADQRWDDGGRSLADPASSGNPAQHHGDFAWYAVMDQLVWRSGTEPNRTLGVFARFLETPLTERNLIDFSMNAGVVLHCPFTYRTDDTLGLGMGYAHVSRQAAALDRDTAFFTQTDYPVRTGETFVEVTYQYQVTSWLQLQPDTQYVVRPGAGVENPGAPPGIIKNEWVVGVRANVLI